MKIFLDDQRDLPLNLSDWTLCRFADELIGLLRAGGVQAVSLDYDMGSGYTTGLHVVRWILKEVKENPAFTPPRIRVHTASIDMKRDMLAVCAQIDEAVKARSAQ